MADHREVEQLFSRIEALPTGDSDLRGLVDEVTIELVRHSVEDRHATGAASSDDRTAHHLA